MTPPIRMVSVPVEPTPDMNIAGGIAICEARETALTAVDEADACYRAMLTAAPVREEGGAEWFTTDTVEVEYHGGNGETHMSPWEVDWGNVSRWRPQPTALATREEGGVVDALKAVLRTVAFMQSADCLATTPAFKRAIEITGVDFGYLATREEAPAEAGDTLHPDAQPFEQYPELALHIERMAISGVVGSMISWDAFLRELNAALRAQPPAREDAQPVASAYRVRPEVNDPEEWTLMHPERAFDYLDRPGWETQPLYTHPAPDALRVAVEALETINHIRSEMVGVPVDSEAANAWALALDAAADHARQALAALQAEQKGGA